MQMSSLSSLSYLSISLILVLNFTLLCSSQTIPNGVCAPLASTSLCQDIFPASRAASVFISATSANQTLNTTAPSSNCQGAQEAQITSKGTLLFAALAQFPKCQSFFASFLCSSVYPACITTPQYNVFPLQPCANDANQLEQLCGGATSPAWLLLSSFLGSVVNNETLPSAPYCSPVSNLTTPSYIPQPACGTYDGSYCAGVVNYPVYIPATLQSVAANYQPAAIEAKLQATDFLYPLAPLATDCPSAFRKQMCSKYFLKCDTTILPNSLKQFTANLPASTNSAALLQLEQFDQLISIPQIKVPFPSLPCMDTCTYFSSASCPSLIAKIPASEYSLFGVNCSTSGFYVPATQVCGVTLSPALADYQTSSYVLSVLPLPTTLAKALNSSGNVPLVGSCNYMGITYDSALGSVSNFKAYIETNVTTNAITCPAPLVVADEADCRIQGGACAVPCPSFLYDPDTLRTNSQLFLVVVILSFTTATVFLATWTVFAEKRRFVYIIIFAAYAWLLSLLFVVSYSQGAWDQLQKMNCRNNCATWGWAENNWCTFEGSMIQYLPSNVTSWWLVLCLDLWWKVRVNIRLSKQQERIKHFLLTSLGFGYPMVLFLIGLGVHGYGGTKTGTVPWCFYANYDAQDVIFYYPLTALIGLGFLCICDLLYLLTKHACSMSGMSGMKGGKNLTRWRAHIRPLIFLLEILIILVLVVSNRFYTLSNTTTFTNAATAYVTCLLGPGGGIALCGSAPSGGPNHVIGLYMLTFGVAAAPLLMSVAHLTHPRVYVLWYQLLCKRNVHLISRASATDTGDSAISGGKTPSGPALKERSSARAANSVVLNTAPTSQPPSQSFTPNGVPTTVPSPPPATVLEQQQQIGSSTSEVMMGRYSTMQPASPSIHGPHAVLASKQQRSSLTTDTMTDSMNNTRATAPSSTSLSAQRGPPAITAMSNLQLPSTIEESESKLHPKHFI